MTLTLLSVRGPGDFFLWQFDAAAGHTVAMNSRDGLTTTDAAVVIAGSHSHFNWGFNSNGLYEVTFQATARRTGETNDISSPPTTFVFAVDPVPDQPPLTPFEQWQADHWPGTSAPAVIGPDADPDGDGASNALEFFAATDPRLDTSPPSVIAQLATDTTSGRLLGTVAIVGRTDAADWAEFRFQGASALSWASPETLRALPPQPIPDGPLGMGLAVWRGLDSKFVDESATRYYRIGIRLK